MICGLRSKKEKASVMECECGPKETLMTERATVIVTIAVMLMLLSTKVRKERSASKKYWQWRKRMNVLKIKIDSVHESTYCYLYSGKLSREKTFVDS